MSTLTALARAQAFAAGRAEPIATVRHLHVHDRPLVLIPLAMAGEANAPLALLAGTAFSAPELLVVGQPRNRDERFAFASSLASIVVPYVESFTGVAEPIAVDRGRGAVSSSARSRAAACSNAAASACSSVGVAVPAASASASPTVSTPPSASRTGRPSAAVLPAASCRQ